MCTNFDQNHFEKATGRISYISWDYINIATERFGIYLYIDNYGINCRVFSTGLKLLQSLSNNCHWAWIIDTTLFDLFEPASHDFHLHNRLDRDIRKLFLPNLSPLKSRE